MDALGSEDALLNSFHEVISASIFIPLVQAIGTIMLGKDLTRFEAVGGARPASLVIFLIFKHPSIFIDLIFKEGIDELEEFLFFIFLLKCLARFIQPLNHVLGIFLNFLAFLIHFLI